MTGRDWTLADIQYVRDHYPTTDSAEVASALGRSVNAVAHRASKLGLRKSAPARGGTRGRRWTDEELATLKAKYPTMITKTLAAEIGRSVDEVYRQAQALDLKKESGYLAAQRGTLYRKPKPAPAPAAPRPDVVAYRRRAARAAATALAEHGVDERQAELAVDLVVRGRVPGMRVEW